MEVTFVPLSARNLLGQLSSFIQRAREPGAQRDRSRVAVAQTDRSGSAAAAQVVDHQGIEVAATHKRQRVGRRDIGLSAPETGCALTIRTVKDRQSRAVLRRDETETAART